MALITQYTEHGVKMKMHVILRKTTGAEGGSRTRTTLRSTDFKSVASAIPPPRHINQNSTQPEEATNPDSKILTDDKPSKLSWTVRGCGSVRTSSGQALAVGGPN